MDFALTSANIADETFLSLKRTLLVSKSGSGYGEVRKVLTPRWAIVWRDLIIGWLTLIVVMLAVVKLSHRSQALAYIGAVFGAVMLGFTIAYITLFLHEAAHRNLHPDHQRNDLLCNLFVSGIIGVDVQTYREVHWEHHRQFGGPMDSEISYRDPLNLRFVVEGMFGVRPIKVMLRRSSKRRGSISQKTGSKARIYVLLGGLMFNMGFLIVLAHFGEWATMFSWICGVLVFFPFFGALRQLLEHRGELPTIAGAKAETICLATNRLFGDGPLANTLGGAGFNRHLLHHWDPQVSYTRLRELEEFLLETQAGPYLRERNTTYLRTFTQLFSFFGR
jgi:fatty acid desaturase